MREIVNIFFNIKTYGPDVLLEHLTNSNKVSRETVTLKKLSVLNKFYIESLVNLEEVENVIKAFERTSSEAVKVELIIGLFSIHQWYLNSILKDYEEYTRVSEYKPIQKTIIQFFLQVIQSR